MATPRAPAIRQVRLKIYGKEKTFGVTEEKYVNKEVIDSHQIRKLIDEEKQVFYQKLLGLNPEKLKNISAKDRKEKLEANQATMVAEASSGQLFKLWMPYQPRVFLTKDEKGHHYILSEEIPGFLSLEVDNKNERKKNKKFTIWSKFQKGYEGDPEGYTGLGNVLMACYFCNEADNKLGNLGRAIIDGKHKVIKIDGDWCCASLRAEQYKIDSEIDNRGITELPIPSKYAASTWLDFKKDGVLRFDPTKDDIRISIADSLQKNPKFREEVNEMILKILLTPDDLFTYIVKHNAACIASSEKNPKIREIIDFFHARKKELLNVALTNKSFMKYLGDKEAVKNCLSATQRDMEAFCKNIGFASKISQLIEREKLALYHSASEIFIPTINGLVNREEKISDNKNNEVKIKNTEDKVESIEVSIATIKDLVNKGDNNKNPNEQYDLYKLAMAAAKKIGDEKNGEIKTIMENTKNKIESIKLAQKDFMAYAFLYLEGGHRKNEADKILKLYPHVFQNKSKKEMPYRMFSRWLGRERYDKIFAYMGETYPDLAKEIYNQLVPAEAKIAIEEKKGENGEDRTVTGIRKVIGIKPLFKLRDFSPEVPQILTENRESETMFIYAVKLLERLGRSDLAKEVITHFNKNQANLDITEANLRDVYRHKKIPTLSK